MAEGEKYIHHKKKKRQRKKNWRKIEIFMKNQQIVESFTSSYFLISHQKIFLSSIIPLHSLFFFVVLLL
jgi:hypothetical protein